MWQHASEKMHYFHDDLVALMQGLPYPPVALSGSGIVRRLVALEELGQANRYLLPQYPYLQYEPLEPFYILRRQTTALNLQVLDDIFRTASGWREANYLCLYGCLAPREEYATLLRKIKANFPFAAQAAQLALAGCGDTLAPELAHPYQTLLQVRAMLAELPAPILRLRSNLTHRQKLQYQEERRLVKAAYFQKGAQHARELMQHGLLAFYSLSLAEWNKLGCPAPPEV